MNNVPLNSTERRNDQAAFHLENQPQILNRILQNTVFQKDSTSIRIHLLGYLW